MKILLTPHEARVIGVLIEKEITTPDQYPLSLNALTNACNQKSNRDPVMDLSEVVVQQTVDNLIKRFLVSRATGFGNRVTKYQHRFCNTEFGELKLSKQEVGIVCELLLRGPQTPGELRTHAERLCGFGDVSEVEDALAKLMARDEPFIVKLAREPGRRESRYAHLFFGEIPRADLASATEPPVRSAGTSGDRIAHLEQVVADLTEEVQRLRERLTAIETGLGINEP
jgi:hypothetical protein